jgi:ABC-2 type transport system ATP-binding protein
MISIKNLTKIFKGKRNFFGPPTADFKAVDNISFDIKQGEVVGFLGPNGAGKTTTIKMLLDLLTPTSGSITYFGKELRSNRSEILQHIGYASTYTKLPARMSVYENLYIYGRLYGLGSELLKQRIAEYLKIFGIQDRGNQEMGSLSAGQTTRVMLAKAFMVHPKIALLDEPTAALDPDIALEVRSYITQQQKERGITILLASHNMDEVTAICNRVIVLSKGVIIDDDTPQNLAKGIASAGISLIVLDGMKRIKGFAEQHNLVHTIQDRSIDIKVDEHDIARVLSSLASLGVVYNHIQITKPTLEDYFLKVARAHK